MRLLRRLFRTGRALAALMLLTTLVVGEVADARHHLSEHGCPADRGGRDDQCTCASLHVTSLASDGVTQATPVECESAAAFVAFATGPLIPVACAAAPRAPPRG